MALARRSSSVRRVSKAEAVRNLERNVRDWERFYEVSSEVMTEALRTGTREETPDICFWMIDYKHLRDLQNGHRERLPQVD